MALIRSDGRCDNWPVARLLYSQRQGLRPNQITLLQLKRVVEGLYGDWERAGLFQEWFGYDCVDAGQVPGKAGEHPSAYVFRQTLSDRIWPIPRHLADWSESELFDAVEFMWQYASAGTDDYYHPWNNCGFHFKQFDQHAGRERLRTELNPLLALYDTGYELTADGEVSQILKLHIAELIEAPLPIETPDEVARAIRRAVKLYRQRGSSADEWREAARELAGAFEFLRPQVQAVLSTKDDDLIFDLANRFHIRHSRSGQISRYDARWLRWVVEIYLSTLFLCFDLFGWTTPEPPILFEPDIPEAEPKVLPGMFDPDEIPF